MKYFGLILIFVSCSGAGIIKSFEYTKSQNEIYAFILMLRFIKREVSFFLTRQKDIFLRFENKTLEKTGILKDLREKEIEDEKSPLYHVLRAYENKLSINEDAKDILFEFSESFGRMSVSEQLEKCSHTISELEEIYKKGKEQSAEAIKTCRMLGCIVGVAVVLLLI